MLSKSFKPGKCKTSLKLAVSRIKLLKNKRDIHVKHLRRELAELLATGQEQSARIRVEHVIREEKTMSAYDLIEIYCELIVARMPIIESQKSCPIDLKEAISSVIFASPRCADLPELVDVRKHFVAKYGKEFSTLALELRPNCGVNHMIVEKLSAKAPNIETKIKILTAIAKEHDVKWDSKAYEEELQKPKEDLLNGSSSFMRANKTPMEPLNANFSPVARQNEGASNILQNEEARKPTSFNSTSHTNLRTSASTVPPPTRNESMTSDRKAGVSEARNSYPSEGNASLNQPTWMMEFKDAVSAAQVAAESAERASMAARAAAALASRGNISRQNSNDSNASSIHGSRHTMPNRVSSLKLKDESRESVNMDYNQVKGFQGVNEEIDNLPREELLRGDILHPNSDDMEFSSQINNAGNFDGFRESFSRIEHVGSKKQHDEVEFVEENVKDNYDRSTSASSFNTLDDDTIWTPFGKHQTGDSSHQISDHNQHSSSDFAAPVFDDYDPEPNDKRNLFDSFDRKKDEQNIFSIAPRASGVSSNIFNDSFHESHNIKAEKVPSAKFDDSRSVAFDDSDGISSEDEDDLNRSLKSDSVKNNGLLHEEIGPRKELQPSNSSKAISPRGREENDQLQVSSSSVGAKDSELASGGELGLKFGKLTGGFKNRGYNYPPYTASSLVDSVMSSKETIGSTFSSTEQNISQQEKAFTSHLEAEEDRYDHESTWKASTNPQSVIKAKGFGVEEYTELNRSNKALTRDKSIEDASGLSTNQFASDRESRRQYRGNDQNPAKQDPYHSIFTNASEATGSEPIAQNSYNEKLHTKTHKELSPRMSRTDFDSDGNAGDRDSQINLVSEANSSTNSNIKLSRRTRDYFTKGRNNHPRSTGHSDTPTADFESQPLSRAVDEGRVLQGGNQNLKSGRPNSSAEQPISINIKNAEERPNPDPTPISSRNVKTSDSGSGTKLQGFEHPKTSHVHPKLPDYETLAAHFHSLRSNRR